MVSLAVLMLAVPLMQESIAILHGQRFDYLLMPPKYVCEGRARTLEWSPDGRYLVISRTVYADAKRLESATIDAINHSRPRVDVDAFSSQWSSIAVWDNEKESLAEIWSGRPALDKCEELAVTENYLYAVASGPRKTFKLMVSKFGTRFSKVLREDRQKDSMLILAKDAVNNQIVYADLGNRQYFLATGDQLKAVSNLEKLPAKLRAQILLLDKQRERKPLSIDWGSDPMEVKHVYGVSRPVDIIFQYSEVSHGGDTRGALGVLSTGESIVARGLTGPHAAAPDSTAVAYPLDNFVVIRNLVAMPK